MKINEGEIIPKFYGVAYYELYSNKAIVYPIPFNFILCFLIRIARFLTRFLKGGLSPTKQEIDVREAWLKGFESGKKVSAEQATKRNL